MPVNQWNLVVICLDTFRADLLDHTAPWQARLPNLDRFRHESVHFTAAFGEGEPTIPVRRAYFTGERSFPWRFRFDTTGLWPTGRGWHKIPPEQPTLAEILLRSGYQTGLISDTYHMFKPTMNFTRGFLQYEFIRGYESDNYRGGPISIADVAPYVHDPDPAKHPVLAQYLLNMRGRKQEGDWLTAQTFDRAAGWLHDHAHAETQPFFLWVDSFGPHEPWDPPRQYVEPYRHDPAYDGIECIVPTGLTANELSEPEQRRVIELYLGFLTFVDKHVGLLLNALAETGLDERTLVVVVNDHGTELGDHGRFSKSADHLYAHNTRLFWLVRRPGCGPGTCDALVQSHDLFPTLLSLLDTPHPPVAGVDAWRFVERPDLPQRDHVITGWGNHASVRTRWWNYFVNFERPDAEEFLFDLEGDPAEDVNVSARCPDERAQLRQILETFLQQPLPVRLTDQVFPGEAPIRTYLGSSTSQSRRDAGFV